MIAQTTPKDDLIMTRERREIAHAAETFDAALERMDAALESIENQCFTMRTAVSALRETARPFGPSPDAMKHVEDITASLERIAQGEAA